MESITLALDRLLARSEYALLNQAMSACGNCYDKAALNYLAFIQLASIRLWLTVVEQGGSSKPIYEYIAHDRRLIQVKDRAPILGNDGFERNQPARVPCYDENRTN